MKIGCLKYFILILLFALLIRGWLFRLMVAYHATQSHAIFGVEDFEYQASLEQIPIDTSIEAIIHQSLNFTSQQLRFTIDKNPVNPNLLFHSKTAHCVGYAAYFATTCNFLIEKAHLENRYEAKHLRGNITFLGFDIHQIIESPFFQDHDFNVIEDKRNGRLYFVDASLKDYLRIDYVKGVVEYSE